VLAIGHRQLHLFEMTVPLADPDSPPKRIFEVA